MRRLVLLAVLALAGCGSDTPRPPVASGCDLVIEPGGPSPQQMVDALRAGQTGCLRAGRYTSDNRLGYVLRIARGGVTVRSYPGERAVIAGVIYVVRGADGVTLSGLDVNDPTPFAQAEQITIQVNARRTVLEDLDVTTENRKTCVILGSLGRFGPAVDTVVRDSVLHDCGDPRNELRDHAIYIGNANRAQITGNLIWGSGGFAVQLYPAARDTQIRENVMADNAGGIIFAGEGPFRSTGNLVEHNVIAGSSADYNLASYWPRGAGAGNVARENCLVAGAAGNVDSEGGFVTSGNLEADPGFADRSSRDYRMLYATACSDLIGTTVAADAIRRSRTRAQAR